MRISTKDIVLAVLMLCTALSSQLLRPTRLLAETLPALNLESAIPDAFGDWHRDPFATAQVVNPEQKAMLDKIYSQTLTRTYVNDKGYRIMLSIAYGRNQSKDGESQLHKPEVCYPAQGFQVLSKSDTTLDLGTGGLSATRLETRQGQRIEPLTYWAVVGNKIVKTGWDARMAELSYAAQSLIPDGMLIRVSSIDKITPNAYQMQNIFANAMVSAIDPSMRPRFVGNQDAQTSLINASHSP
jgi:EpsI family protein